MDFQYFQESNFVKGIHKSSLGPREFPQKIGPDGFSRFEVFWIQTIKLASEHRDRQLKNMGSTLIICKKMPLTLDPANSNIQKHFQNCLCKNLRKTSLQKLCNLLHCVVGFLKSYKILKSNDLK